MFSKNLLSYIPSNEWREYIEKQLVFLNQISNFTSEETNYYSMNKNRIFFNISDCIMEEEIWTVLHEYAHYISYNAFNSKGHVCDVLTSIFKKEVSKKRIRNEKEGVRFLNNLENELSMYSSPYSIQRMLTPISDGLGICINTSYKPYGYRGHNKGYPISYMGTELFAELFAMTVMGDKIGLSIFKREFPKTYFYAIEKINGLRK